MIQKELEDDGLDGLVGDVSKIRKASSQLMKWVEEIIDLSKIESGRSDLAYQLFPITNLVEEVTKRLRPEAGNTLTVELLGSLGEMNGDRERVSHGSCSIC